MTKEETVVTLGEFILLTYHEGPYYRGLVNGMILAKSLLTGEEPVYFGPVFFDHD